MLSWRFKKLKWRSHEPCILRCWFKNDSWLNPLLHFEHLYLNMVSGFNNSFISSRASGLKTFLILIAEDFLAINDCLLIFNIDASLFVFEAVNLGGNFRMNRVSFRDFITSVPECSIIPIFGSRYSSSSSSDVVLSTISQSEKSSSVSSFLKFS